MPDAGQRPEACAEVMPQSDDMACVVVRLEDA